MTKESAKLVFALLTLYKNLYTDKYGKTPVINQYREKWAMESVLESLGYDQSKIILEYYFKVSSDNRHSLSWFYYNFDKLQEMYESLEEDKVRRAKIREATKALVEEYDEVLKRLRDQ